MIKVGIIGHFGFGKDLSNGQTIKTINVTKALSNNIGKENVFRVDTHGGLKALFKLPFQISSCLRKAESVIIMPANRGLQIISPLLLSLNKRKKRKIHYIVVGGWLPSLCLQKPKLAEKIRKFDCVYVETLTMKKALEEQGFSNVILMPNFKYLTPLSYAELKYQSQEPLPLCTFSRVMKEKGIEDIVEAVKRINDRENKIIFSLDIYGEPDSSQINWFNLLCSEFPPYIQYKGCVSPDKSVDVVKNYFALVFPTKFYTEGLPGTILDAYSAGVPVIASRWENFDDLIEEGKTGAGFEFNNLDDLISVLTKLSQHYDSFNKMKQNCLTKAQCYSPENVIKVLLSRL